MLALGCRSGGSVVPAPDNTGVDAAGTEQIPQGCTVVSLVCTETYRMPDGDTINGGDRERLIVSVCPGNHERQEVPLRVNDDAPFYPVDTMFSRVSAVSFAPFFDFTTEASR
jgi:hypothetical protein